MTDHQRRDEDRIERSLWAAYRLVLSWPKRGSDDTLQARQHAAEPRRDDAADQHGDGEPQTIEAQSWRPQQHAPRCIILTVNMPM